MKTYNSSEVAKLLNVHPRTARRLIGNGELGWTEQRAERTKYYATDEQIEEWLKNGGSKGSTGVYNLFPLKQLVREKYGSQLKFASEVGLCYEHTNKILKGYEPFTFATIERFCELLDIPVEQIGYYFFTKKEA